MRVLASDPNCLECGGSGKVKCTMNFVDAGTSVTVDSVCECVRAVKIEAVVDESYTTYNNEGGVSEHHLERVAIIREVKP